jgi:hypothetical protein
MRSCSINQNRVSSAMLNQQKQVSNYRRGQLSDKVTTQWKNGMW